jgi:hypothetical protein
MVSRISPAGTTSEDADNASLAINDDGPGISRSGEVAVLGAIRIDGNLQCIDVERMPSSSYSQTKDAMSEPRPTVAPVVFPFLATDNALLPVRGWRRLPSGYGKEARDSALGYILTMKSTDGISVLGCDS